MRIINTLNGKISVLLTILCLHIANVAHAANFDLKVSEYEIKKGKSSNPESSYFLSLHTLLNTNVDFSSLTGKQWFKSTSEFFSNGECEITLPFKGTLNKEFTSKELEAEISYAFSDKLNLFSNDHTFRDSKSIIRAQDNQIVIRFGAKNIAVFTEKDKLTELGIVILIKSDLWEKLSLENQTRNPVLNLLNPSENNCNAYGYLSDFMYDTLLLWGGGVQANSRLNVDFHKVNTGDIYYLHDQIIVEQNGLYSVEFSPRNDSDPQKYEYQNGTNPRIFTNYIENGTYNIIISNTTGSCVVTIDNYPIRGKLLTRPTISLIPEIGARPNPWADSPTSFTINGTGFPPNSTVDLSMRDSDHSGQFLGSNTPVVTDLAGDFSIDLADTNFCCWDRGDYDREAVSALRINGYESSSGAFDAAVYQIIDPRVQVSVGNVSTPRPDGGVHVAENVGDITVRGVGFAPNSTLFCEIANIGGRIIIGNEQEGGYIGSFPITVDDNGFFSQIVSFDYWPDEFREEGSYYAIFRYEHEIVPFEEWVQFEINEFSLIDSGWPDLSVKGFEFVQTVAKGPNSNSAIKLVNAKDTLLRVYYTCDTVVTNSLRAYLTIRKPNGETEYQDRELPLICNTSELEDIDRTDINSTVNFFISGYHTWDETSDSHLDVRVTLRLKGGYDTYMPNNTRRFRVNTEQPRDFHTVLRVLHTHSPTQINRTADYYSNVWAYRRDLTRALHQNYHSYTMWFSDDAITPTLHFDHAGDEWDNELLDDDNLMTNALVSAALSEWFDSDPPHDSADILKWYTFVPYKNGYAGPGGKGYNWLGGGESAVGLYRTGNGTALNSDRLQPFYNSGTRTFVHETGHNLGRDHVLQKGNEPEDTDEDFPYSGAESTGLGDTTWGGGLGYFWDQSNHYLDRGFGGARFPDSDVITILDNAHYTDLMSYGKYRWISDWQYSKIRDEIQSSNHTSLNLSYDHNDYSDPGINTFATRQQINELEQQTYINILNLLTDSESNIIRKSCVSIPSGNFIKKLSYYPEKEVLGYKNYIRIEIIYEDSAEQVIIVPGNNLSKGLDDNILYTYKFASRAKIENIKILDGLSGKMLIEERVGGGLDVSVVDLNPSLDLADSKSNHLEFLFEMNSLDLADSTISAQYLTPNNIWRVAPANISVVNGLVNLNILTESIDGNSDTKFRFIVQNGFKSKVLEVERTYNLDPIKPILAIFEPINSLLNNEKVKEVSSDNGIRFSGKITNLWDGPNSLYKWYSNIVGEIGTGKDINVKLPAGQHTITCIARSNNGLIAEKSFRVLVSTTRRNLSGEYVSINHAYVDKDSDFIDDNWEISISNNLTAINRSSDFNANGIPDAAEYELSQGIIDIKSILKPNNDYKEKIVNGWNLFSGQFLQVLLDNPIDSKSVITILDYSPEFQNWTVVFDSGKFKSESHTIEDDKGYWFLFQE